MILSQFHKAESTSIQFFAAVNIREMPLYVSKYFEPVTSENDY